MFQRLSVPVKEPASLTALLVMIGLKLAVENDRTDLFPQEEVELLNHMINTAIAEEPSFAKWKTFLTQPVEAQKQYFNTNVSPGFVAHKLARKLMIKEKIENDIDANHVEQVVFLSGGYDHRSYCLAQKFRHVQFYELDRGETRRIKIKALQGLTGSSQQDAPYVCFIDNLHLVECDFLKDDLSEVLSAHHFSPDKRTLIIAEGLTMYLTPEHNRELLDRIFDLLHDGEEALISYRASKKNPTITGDNLLLSSRENFQYSVAPTDLPAHTAVSGLAMTGKMLCSDLLDWVHFHEDESRGDSYFLMQRDAGLRKLAVKPEIDINQLPLIATTQIPEEKTLTEQHSFLKRSKEI